MKKFLSAVLLLCTLAFCVGPVSFADGLEVAAPAAIMINLATGDVVFEKDADNKMYPASTTKIMTALLALEKGNLDDMITASANAVNSIEVGSSSMGLLAGETLSLKDLLYGLLVYSGNDAANVIAEYVSGDIASFVTLMNDRAKELGCTGTSFINPNGLHDDNHFTTARDLSKIASEAMKNETFREIVKTTRYEIPANDKYKEQRNMPTTNFLITKGSKYYYSAAIGIKTGYTSSAKNCLVAAASLNGMEFLTVVLGDSQVDGDVLSFVDSKKMFEYAFSNYKLQTLVEEGTYLLEQPIKSASGSRFIKLMAKEDATAIMAADADLSKVEVKTIPDETIKAPVVKGQVLGKAEYSYDGKVIATVDLVSDADYKYSFFATVGQFFSGIFTSKWLYIGLGALIIAIIIIRQIRYNKRQKRRPQNRRYGGRL